MKYWRDIQRGEMQTEIILVETGQEQKGRVEIFCLRDFLLSGQFDASSQLSKSTNETHRNLQFGMVSFGQFVQHAPRDISAKSKVRDVALHNHPMHMGNGDGKPQ